MVIGLVLSLCERVTERTMMAKNLAEKDNQLFCHFIMAAFYPPTQGQLHCLWWKRTIAKKDFTGQQFWIYFLWWNVNSFLGQNVFFLETKVKLVWKCTPQINPLQYKIVEKEKLTSNPICCYVSIVFILIHHTYYIFSKKPI